MTWLMPWPRRMRLVRAAEHVRGRAVGVFLKEVVLHRPGIVEPEAVSELDLGKRVLDQLALSVLFPRLWQLQLVEDAELHPALIPRSLTSSHRPRPRAQTRAARPPRCPPLGQCYP